MRRRRRANVRDWLINQGASGYVDYDPTTTRYSLPDEHAIALTDETSPFFLFGAFQASLAVVKAEPKITAAIRDGSGQCGLARSAAAKGAAMISTSPFARSSSTPRSAG